jgi:hypothetical protein
VRALLSVLLGLQCLVVIAIMVVIVPIAVRVPTVAVFVPPFVFVCVAIFAGFAKFVAGVLGLLALPAVIASGMMKLVVSLDQAALAGCFVSAESGGAQENQRRGKYRDGDDPSSPRVIAREIVHEFSPETLVGGIEIAVEGNRNS